MIISVGEIEKLAPNRECYAVAESQINIADPTSSPSPPSPSPPPPSPSFPGDPYPQRPPPSSPPPSSPSPPAPPAGTGESRWFPAPPGKPPKPPSPPPYPSPPPPTVFEVPEWFNPAMAVPAVVCFLLLFIGSCGSLKNVTGPHAASHAASCVATCHTNGGGGVGGWGG